MTRASSRGWAALATRDDLLHVAPGCRASGKQASVTTERPSTRMPAVHGHQAFSGTLDMPTVSAPIARRKRYSAAVSRLGPATAT